uniref:Thyroglobulin type-1 domain-containing protein n=1 Tax=Latrodectus hesperus TaxID=256737 RepID=E7D1V0_LATHE|nr:hypothetical protein [Latrodectus hesperus]
MRLLLVLAFCCLLVIAAGQSACEMQKKMASGKKDEFVPTCDPNGDYAQVQCRSGWCWCAKKDGKQLTKSVQGKPDCSGKPR